MKFNTDGYQKFFTALANIPKAIFAFVKGGGKIAVGGAGLAGGAAGGILGLANNVLNTTAKLAGAFIGKFPLITTAIVGVASYSGIKGWMHRREVRNDMMEMRAANNLASAQLGNAGLEEQLITAEALAAARRKASAEAGTVNPDQRNHVAAVQARDIAQQAAAATAPTR